LDDGRPGGFYIPRFRNLDGPNPISSEDMDLRVAVERE